MITFGAVFVIAQAISEFVYPPALVICLATESVEMTKKTLWLYLRVCITILGRSN